MLCHLTVLQKEERGIEYILNYFSLMYSLTRFQHTWGNAAMGTNVLDY